MRSARQNAAVFTVHAMSELYRWLGYFGVVSKPVTELLPATEPPLPAATVLGPWSADVAAWHTPRVLFVDERTLLPILMPLAPLPTLGQRFREQLELMLRSLGVDGSFIAAELAAMGDAIWAETERRRVGGALKEFVFLDTRRHEEGRPTDPLVVSQHLAAEPYRMPDGEVVAPSDAVRALVAEWMAGRQATNPPLLRLVEPLPEEPDAAVAAERIAAWVEEPVRRSSEAVRLRRKIAHRLLAPIDPPPDVAGHVAPILSLLECFGESQPLTGSGNLTTAFVGQVYLDRPLIDRPWIDEAGSRVPRGESGAPTLRRLRVLLTRAGALRRDGSVLHRTDLGAAMLSDPNLAWDAVVAHLAAGAWSRYLVEQYGLVLLDEGGWMEARRLDDAVTWQAGEFGWLTGKWVPTTARVARDFRELRPFLELFGLLGYLGGQRTRRYRLTPGGETAVLAMLRASAIGPG